MGRKQDVSVTARFVDYLLLFVVAFFSIIYMTQVEVYSNFFKVSIVYFAVSIFFLVLQVLDDIGPTTHLVNSYPLFSKFPARDIGISAALFFGFALLNLTGISIGFPMPRNLGLMDDIVAVLIFAPLCEEQLRKILQPSIALWMKRYTRRSFIRHGTAILIVAFIFGLWHWSVYDVSALNTSKLFGAVFLGIAFGVIIWKYKAALPIIAAHAGQNFGSLMQILLGVY